MLKSIDYVKNCNIKLVFGTMEVNIIKYFLILTVYNIFCNSILANVNIC